jgi:hypothetical protein
MTNEIPSFSWKRALLFGAVVFVFFLAISVGAFTALHPKDPEKFGEGAGRMSVWVFGLGVGISYGKQTKKQLTMILSALGVVLCFVFIATIFIWAPN